MEENKIVATKLLFTSGKGGVGKSTLATSFAKVQAAHEKSVLMIDCDVCLRTLDIMLSVSSEVLYDWYDVIEDRCEPESALVQSGNIKLLAAPMGDVEVDAEGFTKLVKLYENDFDYIVLDCPAGVGPIFEAIAKVVDMAIVVSTPDSVCARSAGVAVKKLQDMGTDARLIINRFKKGVVVGGRGLNIDEVIDATNAQLIGIVPEDISLSLATLNGELIDPTIKSIKAMERIIRRIDGEYVPLKF